MKKKTQIGNLITGDLEEGTMTLEIEGAIELIAGKYAVVPIEDYEELTKTAKDTKKLSNDLCPDVSKQRELLIAYEEYTHKQNNNLETEELVDCFIKKQSNL